MVSCVSLFRCCLTSVLGRGLFPGVFNTLMLCQTTWLNDTLSVQQFVEQHFVNGRLSAGHFVKQHFVDITYGQLTSLCASENRVLA